MVFALNVVIKNKFSINLFYYKESIALKMLKNQKNRKKLKLFVKKYYNKLKTQNCEYHKIPQCGAGEKLFE